MRNTLQRRSPEDLKQAAVGRRLKRLREAHGMKASQIADALGVERTYWSRWENGARPIPVDQAYALTGLFRVDLDYILTGELRDVHPELRPLLTDKDDGEPDAT